MTENDRTANGRRQVMSVRTELVKEFLLDGIRGQVLERAETWGDAARSAGLTSAPALAAGLAPEIATRLALEGYLTRSVEVESFERARRPLHWLAELLASGEPAGVAAALAAAEPAGKPDPGPDAPASWRVPGPGGHVRHFLAQMSAAGQGLQRDDAGAKRAWMYGFFLRCCEEAADAP